LKAVWCGSRLEDTAIDFNWKLRITEAGQAGKM
jgi:hypothetical protein